MKNRFLLLSFLLLAFSGCTDKDAGALISTSEIFVAPSSETMGQHTRGYVRGEGFEETYRTALHEGAAASHPRKMQVSAYLHSQDGTGSDYFIGMTYGKGDSDGYWHAEPTPVYWPLASTLDLLAYSLTVEPDCCTGVGAVWDNDNASKRVTLTVPGENTQNDILFASAAGIKSTEHETVEMQFSHAQAWLEFAVTAKTDIHGQSVVKLHSIELENVYDAGTLTVNGNGGNASAVWDFRNEERHDVTVDNFNADGELTLVPKYLDMLIPQQSKTAFTLYYTLGSDPKVLSYRFATDQKSWLMGEKYVYNISITSSEVSVTPVVTEWAPVVATESSVTVSFDHTKGSANLSGTGIEEMAGESTADSRSYKCSIWGAIGTLEAAPEAGYRFVRWFDGCEDNPRTVTITTDNAFVAVFAEDEP